MNDKIKLDWIINGLLAVIVVLLASHYVSSSSKTALAAGGGGGWGYRWNHDRFDDHAG